MSIATADIKKGYDFTENLMYGSSTPSSYCYNFQQPQSNTHSRLDYFSNTVAIDDNQENRNKLIQGATNRLRQKRLEEKYLLLKSHIIELQSKLDIIKLEASISLNSFINNSNNSDDIETIPITQLYLDHFEKRLENHRLQLQQAIITSSSLFTLLSPSTPTPKEKEKTSISPPPSSPKTLQPSLSFSSFTKSSFSSTISSILSPVATRRSSFGEEQEDYYASLNGSPSFKRRKRHQQKEQHATFIHPLDTTNQALKQRTQLIEDDSDSISSNSEYTPPSVTSYTYNHHRLSDIGTPRRDLLVLHSINDDKEDSNSICNSCSLCSCSCSSNNSSINDGYNRTSGNTVKQATMSISSNRNALDDTISFLNDLASDTDDGGFRQELLCLVDNIIRHNNHVSCVSSTNSSAVATATSSTRTTNQVYQHLLLQQKMVHGEAYFYQLRRHSASFNKRGCFIKRWISTGWKYFRFAIVMTLAIMINLSRGPKSI